MNAPKKTDRRTFITEAATLAIVGGWTLPVSGTDATPETFSDWEEGQLDIHHISTGRGDAAYMIAPDGTTILIDAGDLGEEEREQETMMTRFPDRSRSPAQWIAEYIRRFSRPLGRSKPLLNHVLLTHFHSDHIGCRQKDSVSSNGYVLSGITQLAEEVDIEKIVDRGYPDYNFPSREAVKRSNPGFFDEYLKFVDFQSKTRNTVFEGFQVGSDRQFALKNAAEKYSDFQIRNLYANGDLWTGRETDSTPVLSRETAFDENAYCTAVNLSYGHFRYFSGGDIAGFGKRDVETAIGKLIGRVDVLNLNHHGYKDSINASFLASLKPRAMVVPVWDRHHPHVETLARMTDESIYPDRRSLFVTGMFPMLREKLGNAASVFKPDGHVVVRVEKGGRKYRIFVLDVRSNDYPVRYAESFDTVRGMP